MQLFNSTNSWLVKVCLTYQGHFKLLESVSGEDLLSLHASDQDSLGEQDDTAAVLP